MIVETAFKREHYEALVDSPVTAYMRKFVTPELLTALENNPHSRTILADGKPIAIGGLIIHHPGRAETWAIVDQKCRQHFLALHKLVKRVLGRARLRRIEAIVHNDYPQGHRWVKLLGFKCEAENMRAYSVEGKDASLYAMVTEASDGR